MSSPVTVTLPQLEQGLDFSTLDAAFGPDSLGIILVSGLPSNFGDLRKRVLTAMAALALLPGHETEKLESAESMWLTGWSRGKEILKGSGLPDLNKGSYYINCAFHKNPGLEGPPQSLMDKFPEKLAKAYTAANIWPRASLEGLANFEPDSKKLCSLIIDVAAKVANNCDQYIEATNKGYERGFLKRIVEESACSKARLLYYYPSAKTQELPNEHNHNSQLTEKDEDSVTENSQGESEDTWCGEHTDHSCLTGLTSAIYMRETNSEEGTKSFEIVDCPDPEAGLYIRNRKGEVVKVMIPQNCLAFQSGAALEEISGLFKAVSHYVRGAKTPLISRATLAVFCQPNLDEMVNKKENFSEFASRILQENH